MAYEKLNLTDGTTLHGDHLSHIEEGVVANEEAIAEVGRTLELGMEAVSGLMKTATAVDLSNYESNGTIVETYSDGSTVTYTMEFDADGNPNKITDSNGKTTVLTW